jgi:hypothetical protein
VKTPLLLTHGAVDANVPPGESEAFYTALKLVGAPVELLTVDGQDHHIIEHGKRMVWSRSIVAWFDKWLKGQPAWWDELYGRSRSNSLRDVLPARLNRHDGEHEHGSDADEKRPSRESERTQPFDPTARGGRRRPAPPRLDAEQRVMSGWPCARGLGRARSSRAR